MTVPSDRWPQAHPARRRWTPITYDDMRRDMDEAIDACRNDRWPLGWLSWRIRHIKADAKAIRCTTGDPR